MGSKRALGVHKGEREQKRTKLIATAKDCSDCGESKSLDQYSAYVRNKPRLRSRCKACCSVAGKKYRNTESGFLKSLIKSCTSNTAKRNSKGRNLTSTITEEKLKGLIKNQNGRCAVSGAVLVFKQFSNNKASVDRINDDLGYVDGNCRLVCLEFNTATKWSWELLVKAVSLSGMSPENFEDDISDLEMVLSNKHFGIQKKWTINTENGKAVIFCHNCSTTKPREEFTKKVSHGCKACRTEQKLNYHSSWRGALKLLIGHARENTKARNKCLKKGATKHKCDITYKELVGILKKQGGMCAYSRVALSPKMGDWKVSLERIDVKKGYSINNVHLVCQRFNACDCSAKADGPVQGSGGWSREKFLQYAQLIS